MIATTKTKTTTTTTKILDGNKRNGVQSKILVKPLLSDNERMHLQRF